MSNEIKPCPCCGNEVEISETEGCDFVIACNYCGISILDDMHWNIEGYNAKQNVIDKWNTRAANQQNEALLAQVEEMRGIIEAALGNKWEIPTGVLFPVNVVKSRSALAREPQQSLDSLKARIKQKTVSDILNIIIEEPDYISSSQSTRQGYVRAVNDMQSAIRKYQPSNDTKADK